VRSGPAIAPHLLSYYERAVYEGDSLRLANAADLFFARRLSVDNHLSLESSKSNWVWLINIGAAMLRLSANRGIFVRAVCVLSVVLVCVMGTVQATHSHSENSTTSRHTCSICATAHAGLSTQTCASAPVLLTAVLVILVAEVSPIFRSVTTQFIRPPPAS
jgi:hypothetical protein